MVLDDKAMASSDDFVDSETPQDDADKYDTSSSKSSSIQYALDMKQFPQPFFLLRSERHDTILAKIIQERLHYAQKILNRPLNNEEVNALAFWSAKREAITSYSFPIGGAYAGYKTYQTASTFKFPLIRQQPGDVFNSQVFPNVKMPLLTGGRAQLMWHALRFTAYAGVATFWSNLVLTFYAMTNAVQGAMDDPRLQDFRKAVQTNGSETRRRGQQGPVAWEPREVARPAPAKQQVDDASPTSDFFEDENKGGQDRVIASEAQARTSRPAMGRLPRTTPTRPQEEPAAFNDIDDNSPTGGRGGMTEEIDQGESAWARIRREAASGSASSRSAGGPRQTSWQQRSGATEESPQSSEDTRAFFDNEDKRRAEREQAQREFDERLERERHGEDFGSSDSGPRDGPQKRW
jgi:hypothetical protein